MNVDLNIIAPGELATSFDTGLTALQSFFDRDPGVFWILALAAAALGLLWTKPWRAFTPRGKAENGRRRGLEHALAGRPAEAQKCYRKGLEQSAKIPDALRVRLLVCLGDALMDEDRLTEAEDCFSVALQIGDKTGSCQGSIADLLIKRKREPEKALKVADHAYALEAERFRASPVAWKEQYLGLREAACLARKARAFVLLDQNSDARQAVEKAVGLLKSAEEAHGARQLDDEQMKRLLFDRRGRDRQKLQFAALHFTIGNAFLALKDTQKAIAQFKSGRDGDPRGKYRKLCEQRLAELGPSEQRAAGN
jgi:tetratricopeptide (TPR) repeat protein